MNFNNKNKAIKLICLLFINVIILFFCAIGAEIGYRLFLCQKYNFELKDVKKNIFRFKSTSVDQYFTKLFNNQEVENSFTNAFRPDIVTNSKEKPILFMGCSFVWGDGLDEKDTISAKTAKLTARTVYNRAGNAWGLDQLLYQLRRKDFYDKVEEPEYLIYLFIAHHIVRLDKFKNRTWCEDFQPHYKLQKGILVEQKPHWYNGSWIVEEFMYGKKYRNPYKNADEEFDRIKPYFIQSKEAMRKHWKNTKFVILKYPIDKWMNYDDKPILALKRWKELEDEGFIIINITDLSNEPFWQNEWRVDSWHPNAHAWDLLLPGILGRLDIFPKHNLTVVLRNNFVGYGSQPEPSGTSSHWAFSTF